MKNVKKPIYKRVAIKLSGEALMGDQGFGISPEMIKFVAGEIRSVAEMGVQTGIIVGGGNIFRGIAASSYGMDRTSADHMGMLATVINSLALQDALEKQDVQTRVQTAMYELAVKGAFSDDEIFTALALAGPGKKLFESSPGKKLLNRGLGNLLPEELALELI